MVRAYKDIPVALNSLYKDHDYIKRRHGQDIQVTVDSQVGVPSALGAGRKRRRQVTLIKDSFTYEEENAF